MPFWDAKQGMRGKRKITQCPAEWDERGKRDIAGLGAEGQQHEHEQAVELKAYRTFDVNVKKNRAKLLDTNHTQEGAVSLGPFYRAAFSSSPGVQRKVDRIMHQLGLRPGHFTAAHVRARYPLSPRRNGTVVRATVYQQQAWVQRAIECAVGLGRAASLSFLPPI